MRDDLSSAGTAALESWPPPSTPTELDEEQLTAWLSALNDLRLVLGTQLDVSEDELAGDTPAHALYHYLGYLQEEIVSRPRRATTTGSMDIDLARAFLREHHRSVLATIRGDGRPQMSPVVHAVDDEGRVMISSRETGLQGQST